jgi:hypothetical protein
LFLPFSFIKSEESFLKLTSGADGDLVILNGQTVDVAEGSVKQYNSIRIDTGGTLRITGNVGTWTEIACRNNCQIDGTIISRAGYDGQTTHTGGTFSKTSSFGFGPLSYTTTQSAGGAGGTSMNGGSGVKVGGAQSTGNGGGGGGFSGNTGQGGVGGDGNSAGENSTGGRTGGSANVTLGNGSSSSFAGGWGRDGGGGGGGAGGSSTTFASLQGGGGGGYRGHHGKGLLLFVEGRIFGSGSINVGGRTGFNGSTGDVSGSTYLSGGGGGGAGGSGGKAVVRYYAGSLPTIITSGGAGGAGALGGDTTLAQNGSAGSAGSSDVVQLTRVTGVDGDLVVLNGQTVDIPEGSTKNYKSITINTGGTLRITGNTGAWTHIGCKNNCVINGTILARAGIDGQSTHSGGTFNSVSPWGPIGAVSYTIAQANGGAGGNGGAGRGGANQGIGGAQASGIGGGGGGGGNDLTTIYGGNGGSGGNSGSVGSGSFGGGPAGSGGGVGNGANANDDIGGSGASGGGSGGNNSFGANDSSAGSGGGGGYKGHHGKGLVLYVEGTLSGTGSIDVSGRAGFSAGAGGRARVFNNSPIVGSGGGGGGGAGGSGGKIVLRYTSGTVPTITLTGGSAGSGGSAGTSYNNGSGATINLGSAGSNGTAGNAGSSDIATL